MKITAAYIASYIDGLVEGNENVELNDFAKLNEGKPGALSFFWDPAFESHLYDTKSSAVVLNRDFQLAKPVECTLIRVDNPQVAMGKLLTLYASLKQAKSGISKQACISETAQVGEDCYVGPFAVIGENAVIGKGTKIYPGTVIGDRVVIGENTCIYPNVTIYEDCKIGARVILHAGCVIGADGFGFAPTPNGYQKIPQIGIVTIEDDVEIGANTCVDRSTMGSTYVRKGVKLDNLVQIAHNVDVGQHTVMSSQTGIAGSAKIGEWCMFGGQVGIAGHIAIGPRTHVGAQSGIAGGNAAKRGGATLMGYPAVDHRAFARQAAAMKSLPDLLKEVAELRRKIEELEAERNH